MADVKEIGICQICDKPLAMPCPEGVNYNGQMVHKECVPEADERDPNQSYT